MVVPVGSLRCRWPSTLGLGIGKYATGSCHQAFQRSAEGPLVSGCVGRSNWRCLSRWMDTVIFSPALLPRPRMGHGHNVRRLCGFSNFLFAHRGTKPEQSVQEMMVPIAAGFDCRTGERRLILATLSAPGRQLSALCLNGQFASKGFFVAATNSFSSTCKSSVCMQLPRSNPLVEWTRNGFAARSVNGHLAHRVPKPLRPLTANVKRQRRHLPEMECR